MKNTLNSWRFPRINSNSPSSLLATVRLSFTLRLSLWIARTGRARQARGVAWADRLGSSHILQYASQIREYIHGKRENNCRVLFRADFDQRLQVAELDGRGLTGHCFGGSLEVDRGFGFAFRVDDLCAALAFRLRLAGDGADHLFRQVHLLHLDQCDLHAPGAGMLIE